MLFGAASKVLAALRRRRLSSYNLGKKSHALYIRWTLAVWEEILCFIYEERRLVWEEFSRGAFSLFGYIHLTVVQY